MKTWKSLSEAIGWAHGMKQHGPITVYVQFGIGLKAVRITSTGNFFILKREAK